MTNRRPGPYFGQYGRRRPVVGGLEARSQRGSFGRTWWGRELVDIIEFVADTGRMSRGRTYARGGQVISLEISSGMVTGEVQGSQIQPFVATMSIDRLDPAEIEELVALVRRQPGSLAMLAGGEVPEILGPLLLPARASALNYDCTCPDDGWPCKHAAAIAYLTTERIDENPLEILTLRGVDLDMLIDGVGGESNDADVDDWFGDEAQLPALPDVDFRAAIDDLDPLLLRKAIRSVSDGERAVDAAVRELKALYQQLR
ncbi:SWIM zinc finger family protein [Rhodococcus marinonascens]|uniref:SWIM zinc finger family protein n=1 Tax=Rhodococcus marinonascens TaxID=38311 RepID=UPI000935362B|nr:SWIM zinc finger family protein [Rhodococcus marinonascens]